MYCITSAPAAVFISNNGRSLRHNGARAHKGKEKIMSLIVKDPGNGGGDFVPAPEGQFQAVCVDVIDEGISKRFSSFSGQEEERDELRIVFQLKVADAEGKEIKTENGGRFIVSQLFKKSLHEKSKLRPFLESWRGRKFTNDELDGFDVEKLIGVNALIQTVHNVSQKNGKTYANIQSIMPINPAWNLAKLETEGYTRKKDRAENKPIPVAASAPVSFVPQQSAAAATAKPFDRDEIPF
jgi:hypothetical protein